MIEKQRFSQFGLISKSWSSTIDALLTWPRLMRPFFFMAVFEIGLLVLLFVALQPPFVEKIAPVVVRYWGQGSLHFPQILLLLARLFNLSRYAIVLLIGAFATGMTIAGVEQYHNREKVSLRRVIGKTFRKYIGLIIITLIAFGAVAVLSQAVNRVAIKILSLSGTSGFMGISQEYLPLLFIAAGIIAAGFVQALFVFAAPALMIDDTNFLKAVFRNFKVALSNLAAAIFLVVLPIIILIPIQLLLVDPYPLMRKSFPEIIFVLLSADVLVTMLVNVFITISAANCYIILKGRQRK